MHEPSQNYNDATFIAISNSNNYLDLLNPYIKETTQQTMFACSNALCALSASLEITDPIINRIHGEIEGLGLSLVNEANPSLATMQQFIERMTNIIKGLNELEYPSYEIALLEVMLYAFEYVAFNTYNQET